MKFIPFKGACLCLLLAFQASAASVVINEIMYHPAPAIPEDKRREWIELHNPGTNTVDLSGWRFDQGVDYTFPANTTLAPGAYLVVAANRASFQAEFPAVANVLGDWTGQLSNTGEDIELIDAQSETVTTVRYADAGDWAVRQRVPDPTRAQPSWDWLALHDGQGPSLELINPALPNSAGQNWLPSQTPGGTPGAANSTRSTNIAPLILETTHLPAVPKSTEPVTITARLVDEQSAGVTGTVFYRDATTPTPNPNYSTAPMFDDGAHNDGLAGDGLFGATLSAMPHGTVIEFYIQATDSGARSRTWPAPALDGVFGQLANANLQFDDETYAGDQPILRLILTGAERQMRATLDQSNTGSDAQQNLTLITLDAAGPQIRHLADMRIRGAGSRGRPTKNYRVNIPSDRPWHGLTAINLNSQYPHAQIIGSVIAQKFRVPSANARFVQVRVNAINLARSGPPTGGDGASWGTYALLEPINNQWAERIFPTDGEGNVYRASTGAHNADLSFGTTPQYYRNRGYDKTANSSDDDWSDLMDLTAALSDWANPNYAQAVRAEANVEEWMRYFAVFTLLTSMETSLGTGRGDDYGLYRGLLDTRFLVIGHDFDTILGQGDTAGQVGISIYRMVPGAGGNANVQNLTQFMWHPEFAPIYLAALKDLADTWMSPQKLNPIIDQFLTGVATEPIKDAMKTFAANRVANVLGQIPQAIRVTSAPPLVNGYPQTTTPLATLSGVANAIHTRTVLVNGQIANWSAYQGAWNISALTLNPGLNRVLIRAFNAQGAEFERATIDVWYDDGSIVDIASDITTDTAWAPAGGPYRISGVVEVSATLTIHQGTAVHFGPNASLLVVDTGRLIVEGTDAQRVVFARDPGGAARWSGIDINGSASSPESRIAYAHFEGNSATALHATDATVLLDHLTFGTPDRQYLSLDRSSFVVQDCEFPTTTAGFEPVHGSGGIKAGGHGIFRRNFWGKAQGYNDSLDFTGGNRPGPILQILNNVFMGSDDDLLDLDSTDAWVEGNIFLHTHRNNSPDSASGVSGGSDNPSNSEITIIGNLFYDVDHAVNAKQTNYYTLLRNTIVRQTRQGGVDIDAGVVTLADEGTAEGAGLYLEGNIIFDAEKLLRLGDPAKVTLTNNLLWPPGLLAGWPAGPNTGGNQTNLAPLFRRVPAFSETTNFNSWAAAQVMWDWFSLQPNSPAPLNIERSAILGATIHGAPNGVTFQTTATLTVGPNIPGSAFPFPSSTGLPNGSGFTHYRWRWVGPPSAGAWSAETPIATPITLSGLASGAHYVEVSGKNDAGFYQDDPVFGPDALPTRSRTWTVNTSFGGVRLNEILAANQAAFAHEGTFPDAIELYNAGATAVDLSGWGLTDVGTNRFKFKFPADTMLASGQYLVLFADSRTDLSGLHLGFGLDQAGDGVFLYNTAGDLVDSVQFGIQLGDLSVGRANNSQWTLCRPTLGAANATHPLGDPFALKINEWLANAGTLFPNDFVEIYNPNSVPVLLGGLYLTDEPFGWPTRHRVPALTFMGGQTHFVFTADGDPQDGADHLDFRLSANQGAIGLFDSTVSLIDCVFYGTQLTDISEGRRPSGASTIGKITVPTPGAPNPGGGGSIIVISNTVANIFGVVDKQWRFDDDGIDRGTAWRAAGYDDSGWSTGFALFGFETTPQVYPYPFQTFSPSPDQGGPNTIYLRTHFNWSGSTAGWSLIATSYVDDGAVFYLNGVEAGRVRINANPVFFNSPAQNANDGNVDLISLATASLVNGDNVLAVEVHQPGGGSSDVVFGMALSAVKSETNVLVFGLALNEVLARNVSFTNASSGGTNAADWIELFNPSTNSFDLSGLSVSDNLGNPRRWVFPNGAVLGAGEYLVVQCDPGTPASTSLGGQSMVLNTGFGLAGEGDAVYLFDAPARGGALLDSVAFGLQALDFSVGRSPNASGPWGLALPTPGAANIPAALGNASALRVNEWLASPAGNDDDFLELYNPGPQPVALGGLYLSDSLTNRTAHRIAELSFIGTGEDGFALFIADGNTENPDHVSFNLRAAGESVAIFSAAQLLIDAYTFGAQENGVSEGRFPDGSTNIARFRGTSTPGRSNLLPIESIAINEVLTHTDLPFDVAIELRNISAAAVDISGWYLSDRRTDPKRFRIPNGTVLAPGAFVVFYEGQFNPDFTGRPPYFALSSAEGEELFLHAADPAGTLTGFRTSEDFGAAENGVSFGRHATSIGFDFTAMSQRTFGVDNPATVEQFRTGTGLPNAYPLVGPIVISEIMYHPPDIISGGTTNDNDLDEFIELHNITGTNVPLYHAAFPTNTWRLRDAVDFDFPLNVSLPADGRLLVAGFNPTNAAVLGAFRAKFGVDGSVPVYGPWRGRLANDTENVELYKPDAPGLPGSPDAGLVPYVQVDKVKYADTAPWPALADNTTIPLTDPDGLSLQRRVAADYGNDPVNWIAGVPTPGAATGPAALTPPSITSITAPHDAPPGTNDSLTVVATGGGTLSYQWRFNGAVIPGATFATLVLNNFQAANAGVYSVIVANGAGAASASTRVDLRSPPIIVRQPLDQLAATNTAAVFTVVAGGTQPLHYQWQKNSVNIAGANSPALVIPNVQVSDATGYRVVITNVYGSVISSVASLSIVSPPVITAQPQSTNAFVSQSVSFNVGVFGSPPLRYQWRFNGVNISGATNPTLALANLQLTNSGGYSVRITNSIGAVVSDTAILVVSEAPIVRIVATDAAASEPGNNGEFTITRSGSVSFAQVVHFTVSGNATPGLDYTALTSPITIPIGSASASLPVTVLNDTTREGNESVTVTLSEGFDYVAGPPASATVVIADDDNLAPTVTLTAPADGLVVLFPATLVLSATASDPDGSVLRVEFFANGTNKLGEDVSAPYGFTWTNAAAGTHVLTAVVTDNLGSTGVSAPVTVVVNAAPSVAMTSPSNGAILEAGGNVSLAATASDVDGSVALVEFFEGANSLGAGQQASGPAGLRADYRLENSLTSSLAGAPALVNLGNNVFGSATVDASSRTVLNFAQNDGVQVSGPAGLQASGVYSVVALFSFGNVSAYRRILDLSIGTSDTGLYFLDGALLFYPATGAAGAAISANTFVQVVLTRDSARNVVGYVNGVQRFAFADTNNLATLDASNILRFFRDDGLEGSPGSVARIRIYDSALSASQVAALDRLPGGGAGGATYSLVWSNVVIGEYVLTAQATDNHGATTVSAPINVTVGVPIPRFVDQFANRGVITGYTNFITGSNTTFTREAGEPRHDNRSGTHSGWLSWTAPVSGVCTMDTFGSGFDTVLAVYTGTVVSNLTRIASNDDANQDITQSRVTFNATNGVTYQIAVDGFSATASGSISFHMSIPNPLPVITNQPQSLIVNQGANVTFNVGVTGPGPFTYQWRFGNNNINGATSQSYTRNNVQGGDAGLYRVMVSNASGSVTSAPAALTVRTAPTITTQPQDLTVARDSNTVFTVRASGFTPFSYQWYYNGVAIAGATSSNLVLVNVQGRMEGLYSATVSNTLGGAVSRNARLTVNDGLVFNVFSPLLDVTGVVWRYDSSGLNLSNAWRFPDYDDSGWSNGLPLFGLEDSVPYPYPSPIVTALPLVTNGSPILTYYFRTVFSLPDRSAINGLRVEAYVDDGAVWYLNGREAGRLRIAGNIPIDGVTNSALAQSPNTEGQAVFITLPITNVVSGENLLAVEVHQSSLNSSDVVFGMALSGRTTVTNGPILLTPKMQAGGVEVTLEGISGRNYALDVSPDLVTWNPLVTWTNFTGSALYLDTAAGPNGNRFYRGRLAP